MEDYFQAKRLLFASPLTSARIVNADDPYGRRLIEEFDGTITFGIEAEADYRAVDVSHGRLASRRSRRTGRFAARVPLPGRFNVLNALAAWAAARALGAPADGLAGVAGAAPRPRPAASSRSRRASRSTSSSTTRTSRARWSRCCWRRANWPPGG